MTPEQIAADLRHAADLIGDPFVLQTNLRALADAFDRAEKQTYRFDDGAGYEATIVLPIPRSEA